MFLFQVPPPTRYDLRFSLFGISVRVHPLFWVISFVFGLSAGSFLNILLWMVAVFIAILVHELGHALAFRWYSLRSSIVMHSMGGLTVPESVSWGSGWANIALRPREEIIISLAGPVSGFIFAVLIAFAMIISGGTVVINWFLGFIPLPVLISIPFGSMILGPLVNDLFWICVFWGMINLVPVYPLDGGNIARNAWTQYDPYDGVRKSLWLSVIAGGVVVLVAVIFLRSSFMVLLFGFLAFQSYQILQATYGGRW